MPYKKNLVLIIALFTILGTISSVRADFKYESNNRYQPTIVLSGDIDGNSFFMAGWGSRLKKSLKKAVKKIVEKTKDIFVEKPIETIEKGVDKSVDNVQDSIEIGKDVTTGDFGELKEDVKKDIKEDGKDFKDAVKDPVRDIRGDIDDTKDIFSGDSGGGSEKKGSKGDKSDDADLGDEDGGKDSEPGSGSGDVPSSNPDSVTGGGGDASTNQPPTNQDNLLVNPFDDLNLKLVNEKDKTLNSFSEFSNGKQERISKLIVLVGEQRANDIDNGIQNIYGKFSSLLLRIIDFNLRIISGSKDFFINYPNQVTERDIVLKLRFAFEQVKNSNSLINRLRENYEDMVNAQSEDGIKLKYEKNVKPLFIQTSSSIKDTYNYTEKIANLMRVLSQGK